MSSPYARPRLNDRRIAAAPSGAAAPAGPSLGDALADTVPALIRIRCRRDARTHRYHDLVAFTADFRRIDFHVDRDADLAERAELMAMLFNAWPHIDWTQDHQLYVDTGVVTLAPEAWEDGFVPEDDESFGNPRPAVHVPAGTSWVDQPPFWKPPLPAGAAA